MQLTELMNMGATDEEVLGPPAPCHLLRRHRRQSIATNTAPTARNALTPTTVARTI